MGLAMGLDMSIFIRDRTSSWEALNMSDLRPNTCVGK